MEKVRTIQANLSMSQTGEITVDLMIRRLGETKRLIAKPLSEFNEKVFRSQVQTMIVVADKNTPTHIKFIFYSGIEITQAI